jgi:hypothetical protein
VPLGVVDGEQHPGPEVVLQASPLVDAAQAGVARVLLVEPECPAQRVPGVGSPAELVLPHHVAVESPLPQVAPRRAGVGGRQEAFVVPGHGPAHDLDEPGAALAALGLVAVGVAEGDPRPGRQPLDGLGEAPVLDLTHEGDDIPAGLAAEAVPHALVGVDGERRRLLAVEGTQALPALPLAAQLHVLADDTDDVGRSPHRSHVLIEDAHQGETTGSRPPARGAIAGVAGRHPAAAPSRPGSQP